MLIVALVLALSGLVAQEGAPQQEKQEHKVPKDSVFLMVTGCLKGRVLAVSDVRQEDTQVGPIVKAKSFRLAGKKEVMNDVKEYDGHIVDVTGLVKKSALSEQGMKVGKGITISGGPPVAGTPGRAPAPSEYIPVLDADSVRSRATSCGTKGN
jgi:hypothetical protein